MIPLLARLFAAVLFPKDLKESIISLGADFGVIQTRVLPNREETTTLLPARIYLPMPTPEHGPFWERPAH